MLAQLFMALFLALRSNFCLKQCQNFANVQKLCEMEQKLALFIATALCLLVLMASSYLIAVTYISGINFRHSALATGKTTMERSTWN